MYTEKYTYSKRHTLATHLHIYVYTCSHTDTLTYILRPTFIYTHWKDYWSTGRDNNYKLRRRPWEKLAEVSSDFSSRTVWEGAAAVQILGSGARLTRHWETDSLSFLVFPFQTVCCDSALALHKHSRWTFCDTVVDSTHTPVNMRSDLHPDPRHSGNPTQCAPHLPVALTNQ